MSPRPKRPAKRKLGALDAMLDDNAWLAALVSVAQVAEYAAAGQTRVDAEPAVFAMRDAIAKLELHLARGRAR